MGHTGILVIGDFTAGIGDPSGRDETRPLLSADAIRKNAQTYQEQAFKVLDQSRTEVRFNSEWLVPFTGAGNAANEAGKVSPMLSALSKITVAQLLEREDFKQRMKQASPISVLEILYPVFQGYDSVALNADVELGGSDQLFNLLVGRDLQRGRGLEPQVVMTVPLLIGTDGVKKMSKSYGNYIGFIDPPDEMFGKIMSLSDALMWTYYELLTSESLEPLKAMHPMDAKKKLAGIIVSRFHSPEMAAEALKSFEKVFSKKEYPEDMPSFAFKNGMRLSHIMVSSGLAPGMNEARRLIKQNAVRIDGKKMAEDAVLELSADAVLQVGSRRFCKLVKNQGA